MIFKKKLILTFVEETKDLVLVCFAVGHRFDALFLASAVGQ
jgi:hypothetical protein